MHPILPKTVDNRYDGPRIVVLVLLLIAAASVVRSSIHIFAADGGAHSIAGIDISLAGGATIVGMFAQWGLEQMLLAIVDVIVVLRYRSLVPFMYILVFLEYAGRELIGLWKPLGTHGAPGVIGDYVMIPLAVLMFILAVWGRRRQEQGHSAGAGGQSG